MINILTIDVEEYYHALFSQQRYVGNGGAFEGRVAEPLNALVDLMESSNNRATFFVVGELASKFPEVIQRIASAGHEIGVHSFSHKKVCEMAPGEFMEDLRKSKMELYRLTSKNPVSYRAPAFSLKENMKWAFRMLSEEGIRYDSSLFPTLNPLYGDFKSPRHPYVIEELNIKEFPLTTLNVLGLPLPVAGGFYLRLLPVSLIAYSIERCNRKGIPFVLYTHPWEIDPGQPKPNGLTVRERFTHYYGIDRTYGKLEYLLDAFEFTSILGFEENVT